MTFIFCLNMKVDNYDNYQCSLQTTQFYSIQNREIVSQFSYIQPHDASQIDPQQADGYDGQQEYEDHALEGEGKQVPVFATVRLAADWFQP